MRFFIEGRRYSVWLFVAALASPAFAGAAPEPSPGRAQRIGIAVGVSYWEAAGALVPRAPELAPEDFGRFDTEGWSVGLRYLLQAAESRSGSLWLGPALTYFRHANTVGIRLESDPLSTEGDLRLRGLVLGAQAEWMWRERGPWVPFVVASVEVQQVDAAVEVGGVLVAEYPDAGALGGSAGVGAEARMSRDAGPLSIRATALVRWFDFGNVAFAETASPALAGPSYQVALGFTWASRRGLF